MKLFKNQEGFNDTITMTIVGGIIGALFITGVFVWQEVNGQKEEVKLLNNIIKTVDQAAENENNSKDVENTSSIQPKNLGECYSFPPLVGFPPKFRETNTAEKFKNFVDDELIPPYGVDLDNLLSSEEFEKISEGFEFYEICFLGGNSLSFVMYGDVNVDEKTKKATTIVGLYDKKGLATNDLDIGLEGRCVHAGFIGENAIIDCSWGDGGIGAIRQYILDKDKRELIKIKECTIEPDEQGLKIEWECTIDILEDI